MQPSFIHLRLHSEFSLVDGIVKIKPLVKRLTELNMPAVAITEQGNLFSLVKFYKATLGAGIKAIAGSDVYIFNPEDPSNPYHLTLLVNNKIGYVSLTELISKAYQEGQHLGIPILKAEWIEENHVGLIALSGAMQGEIGRALIAGKPAVAVEKAQKWAAVFKDSFYLEIQRVGKLDEERYIHAAIQLAIDLDLPVVATNDVRFLDKKDFAAHEVRVCINQGRVLDDSRRPKNYTEQQYLRSSEEMQALFADIPEALANTVEIAKRCNLQLTLGENYLPDFPVPEGITLEQHFRQASKQGLEERLIEHPPIGKGTFAENRIAYDQRLEIELNVICQMGFPGYFMIVADFIQWAKNHAIPVGPGRGSGAGSLVAYVLKITDLDPLEFELLFERFLNPERVSMPDFDIDFCMDRRDEVIDYVARRYGRNRVSQIITYGSMAAKAVIRDVGRVLNHGYGFVDRLAKLIPFEIGMTLDKALKDSSELRGLYESDDEVKNLINMALSLEGVVRNAGKHAGGVVISPTKLTDFSPLYCDEAGNNLVTQFDKDDVEAVGLVKFDFLGLRTLTIIDWALQTINKKKRSQGEAEVDIAQIPRDDADSYKLLQNAQTTAVFQLESRGMKELISRLKPDCFDDIIALVALYRPGPLESGMVDDYVKVKHGQQAAEYAHPLLIPVLKPTNGVILYQEQVMQIAREMAHYTLGGADMLRRAMGKKKADEMAKERDKFLSGSIENKVNQDIANYVFDLMEKFAGYGFNKTVAKSTKIRTLSGHKNIENCQKGDIVFSMNADGRIEQSEVVALHNHGIVPLWRVEFNDGTEERCTLDHKWLTDNGQVPLWKILSVGMQVWGDSAAQARYSTPSKTMFNLHEPDSHRTERGQGHCNVLWRNRKNPKKSASAFSVMRGMSYQTPRNSRANLQRFSAYRPNAAKIFTNSQKNSETFRYSTATRGTIETMARCQSRKTRCDSCQSSCFSKTLQNGKLARTPFNRARLSSQYALKLWCGKSCQTNRLHQQTTKNRYRNRWTLAFSADSFQCITTNGSATRPNVESRNYDARLAAYPPINGMLSQCEWRISQTKLDNAVRNNKRQDLARHLVLRQPVRATFVGWHQGYDLEVNHPEHNFLLTSGLCCSNSHSAAYALVAYQTAWLKAHYPAEFMAAVLSADMDNTDKIVVLVEECRQMKLTVSPPNVNLSEHQFTVNKVGQIVYGLGAIKGAGQSALDDLLAERRENGDFSSFYDLCKRTVNRKVNRRVMESLIKSGAFDSLDDNPAKLFAQLPEALRMAEQYGKSAATGQNDFFGMMDEEAETADPVFEITHVEPWTMRERLEAEKITLGLYLTGHPIDQYEQELKNFTSGKIAKLIEDADKTRGKMEVKIAGFIVDMKLQADKGRCFAMLDDRSERLDVAIFSEVYEQSRHLLSKDNLLIVEGSLEKNSFSGALRMTAKKLYGIEQARATFANGLFFEWSVQHNPCSTLEFMQTLREILVPFRGGECRLIMRYVSANAVANLVLGDEWKVHVSDELLVRLQRFSAISGMEVKYK